MDAVEDDVLAHRGGQPQGRPLMALERADDLIGQALHEVILEPHQDVLLARVVVVDRRGLHARLRGDGAHGSGVVPEPREQLERRVVDRLAGLGARAGQDSSSSSGVCSRVATYAILLQCTGVALWFDPRGPLSLDEVAELHVELVLGSLQASRELVAEAIESGRVGAAP